MFGIIFRRPQNDPLRQVVFRSDSADLNLDTKCRRRGRPKLAWAIELRKVAIQISGGSERLPGMMGNPCAWKSAIKYWCRVNEYAS